MYLKSLELSGFKSFAKKSSLSFNSRITAIVGPNGSGKSNCAEAFRFVLGEQSIKSLRGKRGEDLIWNGGSDSPRANRASVKLTFDNSAKMFPSIDFDEVTLERVVNRDNSNEYLLNGSQVRLKDIVESLASAHIGSSGHHIISQGEADRILSASIRERREMIEDALGLRIYQWKKLESLRKLEKTEENMKQVESLRREIAPHIKFLKKQVEKVEKAEELRRELVALYKEYFACEEFYLKKERGRIEAEIAGPKKELADLEHELEHARKILTDSKKKDQKSDQVIELDGKLKDLRTAKDNVVRELGRLEGEINVHRRAIQKEELRVKSEELRTVYLKDVEGVVEKIENLKELTDVRSLFTEVINLLRGFVAKHKSASQTGAIKDSENEIVKLLKERTDNEKKIENLTADELKFLSEYNRLKNQIEAEKDTNREAEKDVFRIIARQNEVRALYTALSNKLFEVGHAEETFKHDLGEAGILVGREAVDYKRVDTVRLVVDPKAQDDLRKKIERNKIRLEDSGGSGGAEVMKEYKETEERDAFLAKELEDMAKAKAELHKLIADLEIRMDMEFKTGILKINSEFNKFFNLMFGGGKAELLVVKEQARKRKSDLEDLTSLASVNDELAMTAQMEAEQEEEGPAGLDVYVSLPRKKVKGLVMLSGGERALTSIALLFAVSQVNPPPFIILDETDAALDEANSKKYGDMIENLSKHSQLILITHNRETMSRAGVLYGVTMGADGASRLLSIQFEEAVKVAK